MQGNTNTPTIELGPVCRLREHLVSQSHLTSKACEPNAPLYAVKDPEVNVSPRGRGRKWTRRSSSAGCNRFTGINKPSWRLLGTQRCPTQTTGITLNLQNNGLCSCPPGSFTFLFRLARDCQMLSGSVVCVPAPLSSAAAGSSSHCSPAHAYLISGTGGLLFRLRVGA